jgi:hypothetical protein
MKVETKTEEAESRESTRDDKEIPRIIYETKTERSMTDTDYRYIFVSGNTSEEALAAFKEVLLEVQKK